MQCMHWNYRILSEVVGDHTEYFVSEVYYDRDGKIKMWSDREINVLSEWDNLADLEGTIGLVQKALEKPVLRVMGDHLEEWGQAHSLRTTPHPSA